jgi:hypothetical protein
MSAVQIQEARNNTMAVWKKSITKPAASKPTKATTTTKSAKTPAVPAGKMVTAMTRF